MMILLHGAPSFSNSDIMVLFLVLIVSICFFLALVLALPMHIANKLPKRNAILANIGLAAIYTLIASLMGSPLQIAWLVGLPALITVFAMALSKKGA
jgi:hypothetical protein